jgi:quercetin dioxygenase-like cupin family protein
MAFSVVRPEDLEWATRDHAPDEAPRHAAGITDAAGLEHTRANVFRYEPGAKGRRHADMVQEETFVPIQGTLTMYLGDPPERHEVPVGGLIHVEAGTPLQVVNEGETDLVVFIYGAPPERGHAEFFDSAV